MTCNMTPIRLQQGKSGMEPYLLWNSQLSVRCAVENVWLLTRYPKWQGFHKYVQTQELRREE